MENRVDAPANDVEAQYAAVVHDLDELLKRADRYIAYVEHEIVQTDVQERHNI